jgi:hypothetical protein
MKRSDNRGDDEAAYGDLIERCVIRHANSTQLMNLMERMGNVMTKVQMTSVTATGSKTTLWRTSFKCSITSKILPRDVQAFALTITYPHTIQYLLFQPDITLFFFLYLKILMQQDTQESAQKMAVHFDQPHSSPTYVRAVKCTKNRHESSKKGAP